MYGASRQLMDAVHSMSLQGKSLYLEAMLPTAAMLHGLKTISLPGATPYHEAYHCCFDDAERLYEEFASRQTCTFSMLVHPIKRDVTHNEMLQDALQHSSGNHTQ